MMPGENGLELLKFIRQKYNTPVLMLSAMKETKNRIVGFEEGADDYLGKPFEPQELLLRIKAVLRRTEENKLTSTYDNNLIKFGNILYNPDISIVWKNNNKITIDAETNTLSVDVSDEVLESRKSRWVKPPYKFTQGVLHKYIKCVATASEGCVTDN